MRNHWLQLYNLKHKKTWTIEFYKYANHLALSPRQVDVLDEEYTFSPLGTSVGKISVNLIGAMFRTHDKELMDFLNDVHRKDMRDYSSRIRKYRGLGNEIENYELTGLNYDSLQTGSRPDDIKFVFRFRYIRHFQVS